MKQIIRNIFIFGILLEGLHGYGQGDLSLGLKVEPLLSFTGMAPGLEGDVQTSPRQTDFFNYRIGLKGNFEFKFGLGISPGIDFSRSRFGFDHAEEISSEPVSLWGHGENFAYGFPIDISYPVYETSEPSRTIIPFAGVSFRQDFPAYRNMTRLDENSNYTFSFQGVEELDASWISSVRLGVKMRRVLDRMGLLDWHLTMATDFGQLPSFSYEISSEAGSVAYDQPMRMYYLSFGMTLHLMNWELRDGKLIKMMY